ncbi:amidohydrolase [Bacillota bacterium LX-D]|nr:amidohydrolase [Bacillota bacterium LX-D]
MLALINGCIYTMAGPIYKEGRILIKNKEILAVGGREIGIPAEAKVVDVAGKNIYPGLIDAHCHVGIIEEIYQYEGDDANEESEPITPHLRAIDGINPMDIGFQDALKAGVTTVCCLPGSANIIGGLGAVLHTCGSSVEQMLVRNPAGLKVAFGENPKRNYGEQKKMPVTRMANAALLRENLVAAENYLKKGVNADRNLKLEALGLVLEGKIPIRAHAHRADDILTAIRIAEEFGVQIVVEHCTEGHLIADMLAKKNVPLVVGPVLINRAKVELKERTLETAGILAQKGLTVALMTDHPVVPIEYLSLSAALAAKAGLSTTGALEAITIKAAQILGLEKQLGSIEPGKNADLIVTEGSILDLNVKVEFVLIAGKQVYSIYNLC